MNVDNFNAVHAAADVPKSRLCH